MPDAASVTAHFDVLDAKGVALNTQMRNQLPGYLLPRLVREELDGASKTPVPIDRLPLRTID